jgi:hypothetical protein
METVTFQTKIFCLLIVMDPLEIIRLQEIAALLDTAVEETRAYDGFVMSVEAFKLILSTTLAYRSAVEQRLSAIEAYIVLHP